MSGQDQRLEPHGDEVAAKVIDGEAIIIRLTDGVYYSMDKVGGVVWSLIEAKHSLGEISARLASQFDVTAERAFADLQTLAGELVAERLVRVAQGDVPARPAAPPPPAKSAYVSPKLNIYRDMGDLLALDPPAPGVQDIPWKA